MPAALLNESRCFLLLSIARPTGYLLEALKRCLSQRPTFVHAEVPIQPATHRVKTMIVVADSGRNRR